MNENELTRIHTYFHTVDFYILVNTFLTLKIIKIMVDFGLSSLFPFQTDHGYWFRAQGRRNIDIKIFFRIASDLKITYWHYNVQQGILHIFLDVQYT